MAITYPDTGFLSIAAGSGADTTATLSATLTAGVSKLVVSAIGRDVISGVTYNGVAMTLVQASTLQYTYNYHSVYYLDSPLTGSAANIVVTYAGSNAFRGIAYVSVAGTDSGIGASITPVNGKTDGSQISTGITTIAANSDIIESSYANNDTVTNTFGTDQTLLIGVPASSTWASIDKRSVTTAGAYTVTIDPDMVINQDVIVFEIKIATAGAGLSTRKALMGVGI